MGHELQALRNLPLAPGIRVVGCGVVMDPNTDVEDCRMALTMLGELDMLTQWALGDLSNAAETVFGEMYSDLMEATGQSYDTIRINAYMATQFTPDQRMNISFSHHRIVAKFEPTKRTKYLQTAIDNNMTLKEFKAYIREMEVKKDKDGNGGVKKQYVIAKRDLPVERGDIWEILGDEHAKVLTEEELMSLGIGDIANQGTVYVIGMKPVEDPVVEAAGDVQTEFDTAPVDKDLVIEEPKAEEDPEKVDIPF